MPDDTHGYVPVNGLEMYYEVHGTGRPLILLHGNLSTIEVDFGRILPALAKTRQVIAVEQQAHGHTADIDRPLRVQHWANDTVALLRHLGVERADLLGYSSGSAVAFQITLDQPELVGKLVLCLFIHRRDGIHPGLLGGIQQLQPEHLAGTPFAESYTRVAPRPQDWPVLIEKIKEMDSSLPEWPAETVTALGKPTMLVQLRVSCWHMLAARLQRRGAAVMPTIPPLVITEQERAELQRRVRAHTTPQRAAKRARVVLLAADGLPNRQIAPMVGMNEHTVAQWRRRFETERLAGLQDRRRPGRPLVYDHDQRLRIVATVTQQPPDPASHWSHSQLAIELADIGISASQIGRILADLDIKPHRVRSWITRPQNPGFWERAADICGLYLVPPTNALVLSVDEKTGIGARSRTRPTQPVAPGRPARQEHEYVRHGTAILLAALDVHGGQIFTATDLDRNTAANFIDFLDDLDAKVPADLEVHLVLDNGSSHIARDTRWWFVDHPRFHPHYTPSHASWLNQVELFFSILARRLLKRGEFASVSELVQRIMAFIDEYNRTAKPFRWTYDGRPLQAA